MPDSQILPIVEAKGESEVNPDEYLNRTHGKANPDGNSSSRCSADAGDFTGTSNGQAPPGTSLSDSQSPIKGLSLYVSRQASSPLRYVGEQLLFAMLGWIPSLPGILLRGAFYRLILKMDGWVGIENGVRLRFADNIRLGRGCYLDQSVYLHACPNGIEIGEGTLVMHGSVLHVYNFRGMPTSCIRIGRKSLIGEYNVIRGQGGVTIGNRVYTSPMVQILAVNHVFDDPNRPFTEQGITAQGIVIEDDVWIGSGAVLTDGVRIGQGAVVAAGAVVTRDVPSGVVVAGVPARVVRKVGVSSKTKTRGLRRYF